MKDLLPIPNTAAQTVTLQLPVSMVNYLRDFLGDREALEEMETALKSFDKLSTGEQEERDNYVGAVDYGTLKEFVEEWDSFEDLMEVLLADIDHQNTLQMIDDALYGTEHDQGFDKGYDLGFENGLDCQTGEL